MISCGWCNRHYQQWQSQCDSCGGPMPALPGMELGAPPPGVPRPLPRHFAFRTLWSRNLASIAGVVLLGFSSFMAIPMLANGLWLPALFPAFFALGGFSLLRFGINQGLSTLRAFRRGEAVKGNIASIGLDSTQSMNGKHPWKLIYHFQVQDQLHEGRVVSFDSTLAKRRVGQPLWILYVPENSEMNTLYPPVK